MTALNTTILQLYVSGRGGGRSPAGGVSEWGAACTVERCSAQGDGLLDAAAGSRLRARCAERKLPDKKAWCTSPRVKF